MCFNYLIGAKGSSSKKRKKTMTANISKVTCLVCDWSSEEQSDIENANQYGECLSDCDGIPTLLRWDYANGDIRISNTSTGDYVDLELAKVGA